MSKQAQLQRSSEAAEVARKDEEYSKRKLRRKLVLAAIFAVMAGAMIIALERFASDRRRDSHAGGLLRE